MKTIKLAALAATLLLIPACSSSDYPAVASSLNYTNPQSPSGYYLQVDPTTNNSKHIVLNLMGPGGTKAQGVSFFVTADYAKVAWSQNSGQYATPGTAFNLGTAPQAFTTRVSATGDLQVGIYQKSGSVTLGSAPIVSLGLDLASATLTPGPVSLSETPGQVMVYLDGTGTVQTITAPIAVGTLTAR